MGRNLGAAVLGYVVMNIVVIVLSLGLGLAVGIDGGSALIVGSIVVGLLAALLGGIVCAKVATDPRGVWILIGVVVVLGVLFALMADVPMEMVADMEGMEGAMDSMPEPSWLSWLNPVIGAVGVYIGARLVKGV